jgi:acyl carrier protein
MEAFTEKQESEAGQGLIPQLKAMLVEDLMLSLTAEEIGDVQPLFGPGGLGLDSVDALQIVVALEKRFGLKIPDAEAARTVLKDVATMADAVRQGRTSSGARGD